jgi:hypothetical protein
MDAYLNDYVNNSSEEQITNELSKSLFPKNTIKSFRGWGRYNPISFLKNKYKQTHTVKVSEPTAFRGYGKSTSYYIDLHKSIQENTNQTVKRYNYWRGLRPGAISNIGKSSSFDSDFHNSIQEGSSKKVKSYNYWRGFRTGA